MSPPLTSPSAPVAAFHARLAELDQHLDAIERSDALGADHQHEDLARIRSAVQDLRQRVQRLDDGALPADWSRVRHDLRTPLNHILGYGEMLQQECEEDGQVEIGVRLGSVVHLGRKVLKQLDEVLNAIRVERTTPPAPERPSRPASSPTATGRLLVVDDDAGNRELLRRRLEPRGHVVHTAGSGTEALALLEREPVDVVLLDLVMPGMDGVAVLTRMRDDRRFRALPVVMLSGMDELADVVACIELGADDYLTKPFEAVLLQARIGACLEKKRLRDREQDLLHVLFPAPVVEELLDTGRVAPRRFDDVAVLFADLVGFTAYSDKREPEEVVDALQDLVQEWERLSRVHGVQKVKTIGDSVMVVGNLHQRTEDPVAATARCGLDLIQSAAASGRGWSVRIGIHIGPVVAGVLGQERYQYDLWGDTVNTASRVESHGVAGSVVLSVEAWERIQHLPGALAEPIGAVRMKGKGDVALVRLVALP